MKHAKLLARLIQRNISANLYRGGADIIASRFCGVDVVPLSFQGQNTVDGRPKLVTSTTVQRPMFMYMGRAGFSLAIGHSYFGVFDGEELSFLYKVKDRYAAYDPSSGLSILELVPTLASLIVSIDDLTGERAQKPLTACLQFLPTVESFKIADVPIRPVTYSDFLKAHKKQLGG